MFVHLLLLLVLGYFKLLLFLFLVVLCLRAFFHFLSEIVTLLEIMVYFFRGQDKRLRPTSALTYHIESSMAITISRIVMVIPLHLAFLLLTFIARVALLNDGWLVFDRAGLSTE